MPGKIAGKQNFYVSALFLPSLVLILNLSLQAQEEQKPPYPAHIGISAGAYSLLDLWAVTPYAGVQLEPALDLWILRPQAGAFVTFSGAVMVYGGLVWPARPFPWLVIRTGAAAGYYENGKGIDLGYPLEFRLSLAVLYTFRNGSELGLEASHISNANLSPDNPGTEALSVTWQIPLRKPKKP
jgi:lipid A 3-O-deacylase